MAETKAFGYRCSTMDDTERISILLRGSTGCYIRPTSRHELCLMLNRRCTAEKMAPNRRDCEATIYSPTPTIPEWYMHMHTILQIQRSKAHAMVYLKRRVSLASSGRGIGQNFPTHAFIMHVSYRLGDPDP